jgi:NAD(P)-dependent dehydrogenase (short-subunit alcohol dehydrogenase family)
MATGEGGAVRLPGAVVVVTGGASGIGRALAERAAADGARHVVVADRNEALAREVAAGLEFPPSSEEPTTAQDEVRAWGVGLDVTDEQAVRALAQRVETELGGADIWCSNAGIIGEEGLGGDPAWDATYRVHVLAHVYVARHVLPAMLARGSGHVMVTASAAGLLTELDAAAYAVTKHGSVALAEWLAIRHGGSGVSFSCLCPQGVATPMTAALPADSTVRAAAGFLEPAQVADAVVAAWSAGTFLILPHPEVADYERRRAQDRDRWLAGMNRTWRRLRGLA